MEKIIELNIKNIEDIIDKFNNKRISDDCLNYLIKSCFFVKKNEEIKIVIDNVKVNEVEELIVNSVKEEYNRSLKMISMNNYIQFICFFIGIIFLLLSTLINEKYIFNELLLIVGWVPIWKVIEIELFNDSEERRKRKILKKLMRCTIIERNDK